LWLREIGDELFLNDIGRYLGTLKDIWKINGAYMDYGAYLDIKRYDLPKFSNFRL